MIGVRSRCDRLARRALLGALALGPGCSLMDLGEFEARPCAGPHAKLELATPAYASEALGTQGELYLALGDARGQAQAWVLPEREDAVGSPLSYAAVVEGQMRVGCPQGSPSALAQCDFAQLALAPIDDRQLLALSVNRRGCTAGELRAGLVQAPDFRVVLEDSGIDTAGGGCSGATREGGSLGASAPAVAAANPGGMPQALAAWLAQGVDDEGDACSAQLDDAREYGLEAIAFRVRNSARGSSLQASSLARALGSSSSRSAPALRAWGSSIQTGGYFLAHAVARGVGVRFIPFLDDEAGGSADAASGWLEHSIVADPIEAASASHVSLATGARLHPQEAGGTRLLLAYRTGCDDGVAIATLDFTGSIGGELVARAAPRVLVRDARIVDGPYVVHVDPRFVHMDEGSSAQIGGYVVAWVQERDGVGQLRAARIDERDGQLLEPMLELTRADARFVFMYAGRDRDLLYGFIDRQADKSRLMVGGEMCDATPP